MYQEFPCPAGKQLRNFDADPPPLSVVPGLTTGGAAAPRNAKADARKTDKAASKSEGSTAKVRGDPAERKHIHVGMTEAEVLAKLGRPDMTAGGARNAKSGRWTYMPAEADPDTITTLQLDKGVVVAVDRKVVKR